MRFSERKQPKHTYQNVKQRLTTGLSYLSSLIALILSNTYTQGLHKQLVMSKVKAHIFGARVICVSIRCVGLKSDSSLIVNMLPPLVLKGIVHSKI